MTTLEKIIIIYIHQIYPRSTPVAGFLKLQHRLDQTGVASHNNPGTTPSQLKLTPMENFHKNTTMRIDKRKIADNKSK